MVVLVFHQDTEGTPRVTERYPRTSVALTGIPNKTPKAGEPGMPLPRPAGGNSWGSVVLLSGSNWSQA